MRAAKACSHLTCPEVQPCAAHQRKPWAGSTRRKRLPKGWQKKRRYILSRDPVCQDGRVCKGLAPSTEVDHIVNNDEHGYENLQGICGHCHAAKSAAEGVRARNA